MLKIGIDEETFNEFLYFLELFTTVFCVANYNVQTERELYCGKLKGCVPQISFNEVSLIFVHMVYTGKFLLQMLQTKVASIYWISTVFDA